MSCNCITLAPKKGNKIGGCAAKNGNLLIEAERLISQGVPEMTFWERLKYLFTNKLPIPFNGELREPPLCQKIIEDFSLESEEIP